MNILVLNGSPKGRASVTMQYMEFYEKIFPQHRFTVIDAAQQVKKFETNREAFQEVIYQVKESDLLIWAFPLYFMLVCSQYKRFIELIFECGQTEAFTGKHAAAFSTSIHFFDNTAHEYIRSICEDLGMLYIDGTPAHMQDLMNKETRKSLQSVFKQWERYVSSGFSAPVMNKPISTVKENTLSISPEAEPLQTDARIAIVADLKEDAENLRQMVQYAKSRFPSAEVIDIRAMKFGPCNGCLKCGPDNICNYEGTKDEFIPMYKSTVLSADIVLFAGKMHDRYLSSIWQRYLERTFVRTHQPILSGKQVGYIISGPLSQNANTREILTAYAENMGANFSGIATDESGDSDLIRSQISALTEDLAEFAEKKTVKPKSFLSYGGIKVFRDDIYGNLGLVFHADHQYYKKHKIYDFPQRKNSIWLLRLISPILRIPFIKHNMRTQMTSFMLGGYKKILANLDK
ncbi:MAG: NAD(P)H-dependent oxidoreductase [Spirochaetia bacterium]